MSDGSRNMVSLSFVAAIGELTVDLDEFREYRYASERDDATIVYKVPPSPTSDMLLELKIARLENAANGWRLVDFRRCKKPPLSPDDGDGWGGFGNGFGGWGGGDGLFGNVGEAGWNGAYDEAYDDE